MGPMSYEGPEKYIFISYAHKDSDRVLKILERMTAAGYRIWYDDGIAPGSEWPEDIATHLDGCAVFLAFVSNNSIASGNCRREVTFALSRQKDFLGIVLEPTQMSLGMEMQLSAHQCILRQNFRREEDFIQKIFSCPDLDCCKAQPEPAVEEEVPAPAPKPVPKPAPKPAPKPVPKPAPKPVPKVKKPAQKKVSLPLLIAIIVLGAALIITPVALLVSSLLPLQVAEGASFGRNEDSVSLRGKVITRDSANALNQLGNLKYLYFYDCTFEDGALDTLSAPELRTIRIENADLTDFHFLMDSAKLYTLELKNCGVTNDNVPFGVFTDLQHVDLFGNEGFSDLSLIPAQKLRTVKLSGTSVADISPLAVADNMSEIRCANTKLTSIDALASLTGLKIMDFSGCQIQRVDAIFQSLSVRELDMGGNQLVSAKGFQNFTVLEMVSLNDNCLSDADWLAKSASKLKELDLRNSMLNYDEVLFLADCKSLNALDVSGVDMDDLSLISNLLQLRTLAATDCSLTSVKGIGALGNLQKLYLDGNELTDITGLPAMGKNKNAVLDLSHNAITSLTPLADGEYLILCLEGNPLTYAPGDFDGLSGTRVYLPYHESLGSCEKTAFSKVILQDCPADQQLALKKSFASNIAYVSREEMKAELEKEGLYHPYAH